MTQKGTEDGAAGTRPIRVAVIDDHPVVRQGIVSLIRDEPGIQVLGEGGSGADAVALFDAHEPDVMLLDLQLPDFGGVEVITRLRPRARWTRFIVLTTYSGDEDIYRSLQAGASAYLLKATSCGEIVDTIRAVFGGEKRVPGDVAQRLAERMPRSDLSPRELDVLGRIAKGESNKEIGAALGVSEGTVKTYVVRILGKLGVGDRTAAVTVAIQRGIIRM
jgi:two-component system NarL family response regulator